MSYGLIPMRYAKALYKFAAERDRTADVYGMMKNVIVAFEFNPELQKVMGNTFVPAADKKKLLLSAAGGDSEDIYAGFVDLVLRHRREEFAYSMALSYRDLYRKANNISQVVITSASELDDKEKVRMQQLVEKSFSGVTLEISYAVKPELIGGFVVDVDQTRLDASISNELEQLRQNLLSN